MIARSTVKCATSEQIIIDRFRPLHGHGRTQDLNKNKSCKNFGNSHRLDLFVDEAEPEPAQRDGVGGHRRDRLKGARPAS